MIDVIRNKIVAIEAFQKRIDSILMDIVRQNEDLVLLLNTEDQLFDRGVTSRNATVKPKYTPFTVFVKKEKGQPTNRVTLRDQGGFHESFVIIYGPDSFEISATDPKTGELVAKYTKDIFGLTDDNIQYLINEIKPALQNEFEKIAA